METKLIFIARFARATSVITWINKNLARVIMIDDDGKEYDIVFSEIIGQHSTFKIHGEDVEVLW